DVHEQVARAARPRMVLEMAVARLATIRPMVPIGQLVAKLEALERKVRQADAGGRGGGVQGAPRMGGPGGRAHRTPPAPIGARGRPRSRRTRSAALAPDASDDDRW